MRAVTNTLNTKYLDSVQYSYNSHSDVVSLRTDKTASRASSGIVYRVGLETDDSPVAVQELDL